MIHTGINIGHTKSMGRGVFATMDFEPGTVIEISPVIVMNQEERKLLDQTTLHDYIFKWGETENECCMALGYVPVYNHSYESNCEYEMDFIKKEITIKTVQPVVKGEELFINYNGDWDNKTPVWFEVK